MIPLRDDLPVRSRSWVVYSLILANVLAFIAQHLHPMGFNRAVVDFGMVPARFFEGIFGDGDAAAELRTLVTYMFLHGGFLHLAGNMLFLYIFGPGLESRLGRAGFPAFYLACGVMAGLVNSVASWGSESPMVGASGAVSGLMGAYLLTYPRANIETLIWVIFWGTRVMIPAYVFVGFWLLMQFYLGGSEHGGIAVWAHLGGFAAGVGGMLLLLRKRPGAPARPMSRSRNDYDSEPMN